MKYKTLSSNVDDTLLSFQLTEANALGALLAGQGTTLTPGIEANYKVLNHHPWQESEKGRLPREEIIGSRLGLLFQQSGKTVDSGRMEKRYRHYLNQGHNPVPGSLGILKKVYPHADLYIATNDVSHTQRWRLTDTRMLDYFRDISVSEAIEAQKPMKEFFDRTPPHIPNSDRKWTVATGDSLTSDIRGGSMAGIDMTWFNRNKLPKIEEVQPTCRTDSLEELHLLLEAEKD